MDIYEKLLKNISFTIVVWEKITTITDTDKKKKIEIKCLYSNEKNTDIRQGTKLDDYLKNNAPLKYKYDRLFSTKEDQNVTTDKDDICIYSLTDNIFYEIKTDLKMKYDPNILSFVSCQIRNPLTSIIGALSLIYDTALTKEQLSYIDIIEKSSYDIISLSNDIVDIINIGQGKIKIISEYVELEKCMKEALDIITPFVQNKKLSVTLKISEGLPKMVMIDKKRLIQTLVNIAMFSIKNTDVGSIIIEVGPFKKEYISGASSNGEYPGEYTEPKDLNHNILFKIKDTSNGLEDDTAKCLESILGIKPHKTIKTYCNYEFGLIICKYLCNLMKGHVWFKNSPGFGTTYNFNIVCSSEKEKLII